MEFSIELENIKKQILDYYKMSFSSDEEDYSFNKSLKEKLFRLVTESSSNTEVEAVLLTLAESTGCAEDQEIADQIIDNLHEKGLINEEQINFFYDKASTGRWL